MIDIGDIEIRCRRCGKTVGKLKDLFQFPTWGNLDEKTLNEWLKTKSRIGFLSHNHIDCFCKSSYWASAELSLALEDENDDFELVYNPPK